MLSPSDQAPKTFAEPIRRYEYKAQHGLFPEVNHLTCFSEYDSRLDTPTVLVFCRGCGLGYIIRIGAYLKHRRELLVVS